MDIHAAAAAVVVVVYNNANDSTLMAVAVDFGDSCTSCALR